MIAFKYIIITFIFALSALPSCAQNQTLKNPILIIQNSAGEKIHLQIEIADTDQKRSQGLMYRKKLDANSGMLFVFPSEQYMRFWMKNTYIPLSIAFIDRQGKILEIQDMKPLDDSIIYSSKSKALYALEVNQGWFDKNSINTGCRILNINGRIGK